ncbi:MAG: RNA 2',3'-cyclic phosphodiesterase [Nanoarchaeota archaeon]|nr:RNA 2',3'-cyclic phosphodiesterase [Nanoarchaeota archaeon]
MRLFIAIEIPDKIKKQISHIQDKLPEFFGKKTASENLHLTLKFLGEVEESKIEEIKKKLREIKFNNFSSEIGKLGVFDNRKSKIDSRNVVVWLFLSNCEKLQKQIDEKLSYLFEKEKRFMSHLTIARVKNIKNKKIFLEKLNKISVVSEKFEVNKFSLVKSELNAEGPIYTALEKYPAK